MLTQMVHALAAAFGCPSGPASDVVGSDPDPSAELALLHRERAAREGGGAQGLCVAAATGDVATLRSLAEASDVNKGDYDKRTVRRSAAQTLDWGSDSSARHV